MDICQTKGDIVSQRVFGPKCFTISRCPGNLGTSLALCAAQLGWFLSAGLTSPVTGSHYCGLLPWYNLGCSPQQGLHFDHCSWRPVVHPGSGVSEAQRKERSWKQHQRPFFLFHSEQIGLGDKGQGPPFKSSCSGLWSQASLDLNSCSPT